MFIRTAILGPIALLLVWAIVSASFANFLADNAPKAALYLDPDEPDALLNLAGKLVNADENIKAAEPAIERAAEGQGGSGTDLEEAATRTDTEVSGSTDTGDDAADPGALARIDKWATHALRHDPLNARALRMLGQVAYAESNDQRGDALMQAAAQRSLRESLALYSVTRRDFRAGNYPTALGYADALLRTRSGVLQFLMPMLGKIAETPEGSGSLKHLLTKDPPWRSQFFAALPGNITDARTPLDIFLALKDSPAPPSAADLRSYLVFLVQNDFHELAYHTWLNFLPAEQLSRVGHVFNGDFELEPSEAPFDWTFRDGSGVTIQRAPRPDKPEQLALLVEFGAGRAQFGGVSQILLLTPGSYRLTTQYKSDLASERGLKWDVTCKGASEPLGESISVSGVDATWKDLDFSFTVPETECSAQTLRLSLDARSASEQFFLGSIWYDDVRIMQNSDLAGHEAKP